MNDTMKTSDDHDGKIAMVMNAVKESTLEDATQALEENDGNVDIAIAKLLNKRLKEKSGKKDFGLEKKVDTYPCYAPSTRSSGKSSRLRQYDADDDHAIAKPPGREKCAYKLEFAQKDSEPDAMKGNTVFVQLTF